MKIATKLQPDLEPEYVGAKAANLGRLIGSGLAVPPGFVLTRQAFRSFLDQNALTTEISDLIARATHDGNGKCAEHRGALYDRVQAGQIPQAIVDEVALAAGELLARAPCGLAVRSSSVHEDSEAASFAGIFQSFLGIHSLPDLWHAIKQCWCSAWSQTATDYAARMGTALEPDGMAVIVQQLVPAESAGVIFTADPRTGNPWRLVLESTFGLSQQFLGSTGNIPADRFIFEWDTGRITEKQIAEKPTECLPGISGVRTVSIPSSRRTAPSLQDDMAIRIAENALEIDRLFERRVDIEWAVADDEAFFVQVRPVTALPAFFPHHLPFHLENRTWKLAGPHWYFPLPRVEEKLVPALYRDLSYSESYGRYQLGPIDSRPFTFVGLETTVNGYLYLAGQLQWPQTSADGTIEYLREFEPEFRTAFLNAKQHKWPAMAEKATGFQNHASTIQHQITALLWARDAMFDLQSMGIGPAQGLFGTCISLLRGFLSESVPGLNPDLLMLGHHPDLDPYYPHARILAAEELGESISGDPIEEAFEKMNTQSLLLHLVDKQGVSSFVQAYGDLCDRFGLIPPSRYGEMGTHEKAGHYSLLLVIRDAWQGKTSGLVAMHEQATQRRLAYETEVRKKLAENDPNALPRFELLLDWVTFWAPALNDRAWGGVAASQIRALWKVTCDRLKARGLIDEPDDIGCFTSEDLAYIARTSDIQEGRRILQHRRIEYERYGRLVPPEYLGKAPAEAQGNRPHPTSESLAGEAEVREGSSGRKVINGRSLCPGSAKGIAKSIGTLDEVEAIADQHVPILAETVTPSSGDAPLLLSLMLRGQGMVVAQFGATWTHHIAQIARELGVPIIQISPADLAAIPDGTGLLLDGNNGTVTIDSSM